MKTKIKFRNAREFGKTVYWHVEAYADASFFPVGTAYLIEVDGNAQLEFLYVADQWRRRGIGRSLVEAVRDRWPQFTITPSVDAPCQEFADAVLGRRESDDRRES